MKTNLLLVTLIISNWCFSQDQNYSISFVKNKVEYKIEKQKDRVIPIDIEVVNTASSNWENDWLSINVLESGLTDIYRNNYSIVKSKLLLKSLEENKTIFLRINDELLINNDEKIFLQLDVKNDITGRSKNDLNVGKNKIIQIIFKTKNSTNPESVLSLKEYLDRRNGLELHETVKVESTDNLLTISGYDYDNKYVKRKVILERGEVLPVPNKSYILSSNHWKPIPISIITVPFKVRPAINLDGEKVNSLATSGVTNIGMNLELSKYQLDRYFSTGKKSSHKFGLGFWAAPAVEELDSISTRGYLPKGKNSKQMFISSGFTISYTYNDISFVYVPLGWDFGTSTIGKNWIYNKRRWWGFGIAISPKLFAAIFNK
ncbi:hypothetical protein [Chryseobacterium takakiae]|uniref:Uncharacterized protein n=1 Tax=Chryseobacterium takakiae TaxID=1302685 RepID=A0A1M4UTJ3_9FLAO|nr:hypothetical protein [Chryseobacterium takakiae]SHE59999.1 hypothetical protein SAMN05444408_102288 [Chryseobacterium takakiae]